MTQVTLPIYDELLKDFSKLEKLPEHAHIKEKRKEGLEVFKTLGFPTRKHEEWKYTSVTPFLQDNFRTNGSIPVSNHKFDLKSAIIPNLDVYHIQTINGKLQPVSEVLPKGVKIISIADAAEDASLLKYFGSTAQLTNAPFAALNTALFVNGFFIEVAPNTILDKPLHIVHVFAGEENSFVQPRNLIVVHKSAALTLIESVEAEKTSNVFINSMIEVVLNENAHLDHYLLQHGESGVKLVQQSDVSQLKHSVYSNYTFSFPGASLIRNNLHIALNEERTETHLYGLYLGAADQLIDNHSLVDHRMPNCESNEIYKGVLTGKSTGVFNGKVFVRQDAQKTNAFQQNNNLLLSDEATINSKPQLEIFADDVKCSHGSTIGQLSNDSLFYLQSRGISKDAARALLVNAFASDVTEKIKIPELEHFVNQKIAANIPTSNNG